MCFPLGCLEGCDPTEWLLLDGKGVWWCGDVLRKGFVGLGLKLSFGYGYSIFRLTKSLPGLFLALKELKTS